jgi:hypothetical protein
LPIIGFFNVSAVASYTTGGGAVALVELEIPDVTLPHTDAREFDAKPSFLKAAASTLADRAPKFAVVFKVASIFVAFAIEVRLAFTAGRVEAFNTIALPTGATYSTMEKFARGGGAIGTVKFIAAGFAM